MAAIKTKQQAGKKTTTKSKDFSNIPINKKPTLFDDFETATAEKGQQGTASAAEVAQRKSDLKTQGRKGCKATRINMAFTPENHEFIKVMAKATGKTMTEFTNYVIQAYRQEHPEFMEKAAGFLDLVNAQKWDAE